MWILRTGDQFDIEYPHAFVLPWRCILATPLPCASQIDDTNAILCRSVHSARHQDGVLEGILNIT